jgi:hypothetical protein
MGSLVVPAVLVIAGGIDVTGWKSMAWSIMPPRYLQHNYDWKYSLVLLFSNIAGYYPINVHDKEQHKHSNRKTPFIPNYVVIGSKTRRRIDWFLMFGTDGQIYVLFLSFSSIWAIQLRNSESSLGRCGVVSSP